MFIYLHIVTGCFHATVVELNKCNNDRMVLQA